MYGMQMSTKNVLYFVMFLCNVEITSFLKNFFTASGETIKEFAHLSTPRVDWAQLVTMPHRAVSGIVEHYLLLGQNDLAIIFTKLVMKGAAVPPRNFTCDLQTL